MKKLYSLTLSIITSSLLFSQTPNIPPFENLDVGGVSARVHADGQLFQDLANNFPAYEVPRGTGNHAIYASALWMTSQEIRNNFPHYAAGFEKFGLEGFIKVGPVDLVNQVGDTSTQFQRLWKIRKFDIDNHIANWNTGSYVAPASIIDWPGNGNANTAKILAPFMDLDNDSIYEPLNGEYPLIKGDQAIYTISNSYHNQVGDSLKRAKRDSTGMVIFDGSGNPVLEAYASYSPMKIETHTMVYGYITNNIDVLNTVFVEVTMFNRSNSASDDHKDFKLSVFSDFDLGNATDDYVGTDSLSNMFYAYNGDSFDDPFVGMPGYGSNLPAIGVKFLDYDLNHSMYYQNGTGGNGDPELIEHYIGYQRNVWKNGQPTYYSGDGYINCIDTTNAVDFMFAGDPTSSSTNQWTEVTPCVVGTSTISNAAGDRRMIGGPNLPSQFNHGTNITFNYAYVFAQSTVSNTDAVANLRTAADSVQNFFNRNVVTGVRNITNEKISFNLFPNPTANKVSLNIDAKTFEVTVFSLTGAIVSTSTNSKTINVSDFAEGIYFVQVKTNHAIGIKKLIVKR